MKNPRFADLVAEIAPLSPDRYYDLVFQYDEEHYRTRVEMAGFTGARRVLDAGCGYGQWAVALARCNESVTGIDMNPNMIEISRILSRRYGAKNVDLQLGRLPRLDLEAEQFDLVWCWGVIMFVNRDAALREFNRLLRPGGRLFVGCANGVGRWLYKAVRALHPRRFDRAAAEAALRTALHGHAQDAVPNWTSRRAWRALCADSGLELLAVDFDGRIDVTGRGRRLPMFPRRFLGFENNLEFLARKVRPVAHAAAVPAA